MQNTSIHTNIQNEVLDKGMNTNVHSLIQKKNANKLP